MNNKRKMILENEWWKKRKPLLSGFILRLQRIFPARPSRRPRRLRRRSKEEDGVSWVFVRSWPTFKEGQVTHKVSLERWDEEGGEKRRETYHSIASSRPVPLTAEVLNIWYFRFFSEGRPRELATSDAVMAPSRSCLLANTQRVAFFNSSSFDARGKGMRFFSSGGKPSETETQNSYFEHCE